MSPYSAGPTGRELRAVLCDMDGTLVDTEKLWFQAEQDVMAALGAPWGEEHQAALVGGNLGRTSRYMAAVAGGAVPADELGRRLLERVGELFEQDVPVLPGAAELLRELRDAGVPCVLVTATYRRLVETVLDVLGREFFAHSVAGDEVAHPKPAPDPYLAAAALVGAHPGECVAVEDSPPGLASATAAGCVVVGVPSVLPIEPAPGRVVVPSLTGVSVAWLRELVGRGSPCGDPSI